MPTPDNEGFTGLPGNLPGTTGLGSIASSLDSEFEQTTGSRSFTRTNNGFNSPTPSVSSTGDAASIGSTASSPTTFATSVSSGSESATQSVDGLASGTATNAASNATGGVTVSENSCNSVSCSSALKAAIAVPIVVAALAAIFLLFFCARRRRKNGAAVSEKRPRKAGKKWTRHLRAFSFDAELLMGGRFSSSNSMRSRDPSVRSDGVASREGARSTEPSLHSIEEVAPPYRDAISQGHPAGSTLSRPSPLSTVMVPDPIPRPSSTATAPPPYRSIVRTPTAEAPSPTTTRNPFADSAPVSPIDDSPFNDPPEEGGLGASLSRGSSMYRSVVSVDDSAPSASEAGSIRQAVVGRRVSVRDGQNASGAGN